MQQSIHDFQNLLKKKGIFVSNELLKEILYKFDFIFYPDILQTEKKVTQYENNSKILIIDECIKNDIKYYVICFDDKLIILPQKDETDDLTLPSIFTRFEDIDKYYIRNCNIQTETDTEDKFFFYEIRNFSEQFSISNKNMQHFWSIVVNCLSGFLIKKGYQNSRNSHNKYLNEKFIEYEEKNSNFVNKSYIELRNIGQGSGGIVKLIYHISKEEIFALKIPYYESQNLIERERRNYLNIRYPFIVQYIGYIKFTNYPKYLLLEYVEGKTLDKYDLSHLNDQEKYIIILELLLSIHYLHSHNYIYRDLRFSNIMINQNKDAILIDFDHVRNENDETGNEEQTKDFNSPSAAPEENKTYKSDIYSLGYIIHFILYGKPPIINDRMDIKKGRYYIMLASLYNDRRANFAHGFLLHEGKCVEKDFAGAIHYYKKGSSFNNQFSKNNLGIIYKHGNNENKRNIGNAIEYFEEAIRQKNDYLSMYNLAHIYMYDSTIKQDLNKSIDLLIRSMNVFKHSFILLSLALLLKYDFNVETIKEELKQRTDITRSSMEKLFKLIALSKLSFNKLYESYQNKDFLYNAIFIPIESSEVEHANEKDVTPKYPKAKDLSSEFYKGFEEDL
ncbi:hypothetical protein M9Y10_018301 [Tritrichomonas musculus]|uniref:Protein kinase domain-containing protein n=1 Tax=Tritrichomonas musculus TaxID=1915356 RepID=A0ABR2HPS9_9EUKA